MNRSLVVVVAAAVLVATPGMATAVVGVLDGGQSPADAATTANATANEGANGSVNVSTGSQLSTVLATTEDDVGTSVSQSAFESRLETDNETERATAVADRAATLNSDARAVAEEYREVTEAYRNGTLDRSEYAQRIATLHSRARNVQASIDDLRVRAATVSELALETAGFNESALDAADADLDEVSGTGPAALLEQFTGQSNGSVSVEAENGVSVEVESEDGERSREVRSPTDENESLSVDQDVALTTARSVLSDQTENWTLREASVHPESGYYKFEFGFVTENETAEAEVRVDGSSGEVFRLEEEFESRDRGDESENGDGNDAEQRASGNLVLLVVDGDPAPGETLTLEARQNGAAAADVDVWVDDVHVGTTDSNGQIDVTLAGEETDIIAERGDGEAELEFEFEGEDDDIEGLDVTASLADGTVSVTVTYQGDGVAGATVEANGDRAGTTGNDGTVSFPHDAESDDLELEITRGELEVERTYHVDNGSLVQGEASDDDDESGNEDGDTSRGEGVENIKLVVAEGDPAPNATITVETRHGNSPLANATVWVDDERVGTTGDDGRISVTLGAEETEITAEYGDADAELEFEFDDESAGEGNGTDGENGNGNGNGDESESGNDEENANDGENDNETGDGD